MTKRILVLLALVIGLVSPVSVSGPASAAACTDPKFVTSDPNGMWFDRGKVVHNHMWNASGYEVSQTLAACSFSNWRVVATADNSSGDGAVKTYPNVHRDFHNWSTGAEPRLSAFSKIQSTFASRQPDVGIYNAAYDIWLNGVPGRNEVMIWTWNHRQVPSGSLVAKGVKFGGRSWKVYATGDNGYIAFVPAKRFSSGKVYIRAMLGWLANRGRISKRSTLGQICYGFEIVSTGGKPAKFKLDDFSVTTVRR